MKYQNDIYFTGFSGGSNGYYGGGGDAGYGRFGPGGMAAPAPPRFVVLMRGLPYRVTENDIAEVRSQKSNRGRLDI